MGGENHWAVTLCHQSNGPSPRGWGELSRSTRRTASLRTIPTWVGRTPRRLRILPLLPDHPHVGGENPFSIMFIPNFYGPSPRGWGERGVVFVIDPGDRTIPTWVGRTLSCCFSVELISDHPHVGGENLFSLCSFFPCFGPSPRGWGELLIDLRCRRVRRTIPTWVGRTPARQRSPREKPDHPHVGGENGRTDLSPG